MTLRADNLRVVYVTIFSLCVICTSSLTTAGKSPSVPVYDTGHYKSIDILATPVVS